MPNKRVHLEFDEYLKDHGIIRSYTYADSVHDRMDRGIIVWGSEHRDIDFYPFRSAELDLDIVAESEGNDVSLKQTVILPENMTAYATSWWPYHRSSHKLEDGRYMYSENHSGKTWCARILIR